MLGKYQFVQVKDLRDNPYTLDPDVDASGVMFTNSDGELTLNVPSPVGLAGYVFHIYQYAGLFEAIDATDGEKFYLNGSHVSVLATDAAGTTVRFVSNGTDWLVTVEAGTLA